MGKVYVLNTQTIGRFLRRVECLVCYRCGVELIANDWVFSKATRGNTSKFSRWEDTKHIKHTPKVYHLACAKEVKLVDY